MLNHSDSSFASVAFAVMAVAMFAVGWLARSLMVSELPICETLTIKDGASVTHQFEVCK